MLATLKETDESQGGRIIGRIELVINDHYVFHNSFSEKQALLVELFRQRIQIHDRDLADSGEASRSKPRCARGCDGKPGVCSRSLGTMVLLEWEHEN